jgi:hypothetical protein
MGWRWLCQILSLSDFQESFVYFWFVYLLLWAFIDPFLDIKYYTKHLHELFQ